MKIAAYQRLPKFLFFTVTSSNDPLEFNDPIRIKKNRC